MGHGFGVFEIAAIAIIGGFVTRIITTWLHANKGNASQQKIQELEQRIAQLEARPALTAGVQERLKVLEDIVTSDDFDLQRKFRQLSKDELP